MRGRPKKIKINPNLDKLKPKTIVKEIIVYFK